MRTQILYEDDDILAAYKPAGFAVQTARTGQMDMVSELKNYLKKQKRASALTKGSAPYLGVVHRLDQPVEGLLVFARHKKAAASLSEQLQNQDNSDMFHKHYYAALFGKPSAEEGELVNFLYKNEENRAMIAENAEAGAKQAVLRYHVLQVKAQGTEESQNAAGLWSTAGMQNMMDAQNAAGIQNMMDAAERQNAMDVRNAPDALDKEITLAEIHIMTGRFHQIRAQMAYAGTPLLGDLKYGNEASKALSRKLNVQNAALCAYSLAFWHPVSQKKMNFQIKPQGKIFSLFAGMN